MPTDKERRHRELRAEATRRRRALRAMRYDFKRLEVPFGIVAGLVGAIPGMPLNLRFACYSVSFVLLVWYALQVPPHTRNMARAGQLIIGGAASLVAVALAYQAARYVDTLEAPRSPKFTAEIGCLTLGKDIVAMANHGSLVSAFMWVDFQNSGTDSALRDWILEIKARDGTRLHTRFDNSPKASVVFSDFMIRRLKVYGSDTTVADRLYREPIKRGTGAYGSLHFFIDDGGEVASVDETSAKLHFRDMITTVDWTSAPFTGPSCGVSNPRSPGEPLPNPPRDSR